MREFYAKKVPFMACTTGNRRGWLPSGTGSTQIGDSTHLPDLSDSQY